MNQFFDGNASSIADASINDSQLRDASRNAFVEVADGEAMTLASEMNTWFANQEKVRLMTQANENITVDIVQTEAFISASQDTQCPIIDEDLFPKLDVLVDPCSGNSNNETFTDFCTQCVAPVHALLKEGMKYANMAETKMAIDVTSNATLFMDVNKLSAQDVCAKTALEYLLEATAKATEEQTNPADFAQNVQLCMKKIEQTPLCPDMPKLNATVALLKPACTQAITQINNMDEETADQAQEKYCSECYWPIVTKVVHHTLGADSLCLAPASETEGRAVTDKDLFRVAKPLNEDEEVVGCMDHARMALIFANAAASWESDELSFDSNEDPMDDKFVPDFDRCWSDEMINKLYVWKCS